jgi:glycolate oxidase FAD binding subunit
VTDDAVEVKGGGRVVKNVAGYDLMKLQTGALGTLGVITQLTLKVKPKPEATAVVTFGVGGAALGPTLDRLHASESRPVAVEATNDRRLGDGPWVVVCRFEEKAATADWQAGTLVKELIGSPVRGVETLRGEAADGLFDRLMAARRTREEEVVLRVNTLPSGVAAVAAAAAGLHSHAVAHAHAGSGIVSVHLVEELGVERISSAIAELSKLTTHNGNVTVRRCPPGWKKVLPVWGKDRGDRELMRNVKRTLDPDDVFNPGRLV